MIKRKRSVTLGVGMGVDVEPYAQGPQGRRRRRAPGTRATRRHPVHLALYWRTRPSHCTRGPQRTAPAVRGARGDDQHPNASSHRTGCTEHAVRVPRHARVGRGLANPAPEGAALREGRVTAVRDRATPGKYIDVGKPANYGGGHVPTGTGCMDWDYIW